MHAHVAPLLKKPHPNWHFFQNQESNHQSKAKDWSKVDNNGTTWGGTLFKLMHLLLTLNKLFITFCSNVFLQTLKILFVSRKKFYMAAC